MTQTVPMDEAGRLQALARYAILDTAPEEAYDDAARLAAQICGTPIALVSFVDGDRQWFKSRVGTEACGTSRDASFCAHALGRPELLLVPDAADDPRFADNPLVTGEPWIRFYAGMPLTTQDGHTLGTLCVLDRVPRRLSDEQKEGLRALGRLVMAQLEARWGEQNRGRLEGERRAADQLVENQAACHKAVLDAALDCIVTVDAQDRIVEWNPAAEATFGWPRAEVLGRRLPETVLPPALRAAHRRSLQHCPATGEGPVLNRRTEVTAVRRDGTEFPAEMSAAPVIAGGQTFFTAYLRDITGRRQADLALLRLLAQSEHLLAAIPSVLVAVDGSGVITAWNDAAERVFGRTKFEMVGKPFDQHALGWDWGRIAPAFAGCGVTGEAARVDDVAYRRPDGVERLLGLNFSPLPRPQGQDEGFLLLAADVTERRQAQDALLRSVSLLKAEQEATNEGILVVDEEMRITSLNRNFARLWDIPQALIDTRDDRQMLAHVTAAVADTEAFLEKVECLYAHPRVTSTDEILLKDGRIFERYSGPVVSADGHYYGRVWSFRDITARRRDEEELVRSAQRIAAQAAEREQLSRQIERLSLVSTKTTNAVIITDAQGRVEWVNDSFTRITGYALDEVVGRKPGTLLQGPGTDQSVIRSLRDALREGRSFDGEIYNYRKDGRGYFQTLSINPIFNDTDQSLQGFIAIQTDIWTDRKRTEEDTARLAAIVESSHDAIISKNLDDSITSWNAGAEALYGYSADEAIGRNISLLVPADRLDELPTISERFRRGEQIDSYETIRIGKDGQPVDVSITVSPIKDAEGRVIGASNISRNIAAQKRAEREKAETRAELEQRNWELAEARDAALAAARLKSEFLANMSHEIRTPMNGVLGMIGLLIDTPLGEEQAFFARTVKQSAEALLKVINDILDFSKIEAGKMTIENVPFCLRETLEDVVDLLAAQAHEKGLSLVCALPPLGRAPGAELLLGDPGRLRQVVTNLLGNAIKFTDAGGEIVVGAELLSASGTQAHWRVSVRDTGIGIPLDRQKVIFDSFTQADGSTTRRYGGTGLGLTICRQLAALMGGEVGVDSRPGAGSTFWVDLTLDKQPEAISFAGVVQGGPQGLGGLRVLLVGATGMGRDFLTDCLSGWGCVVTDAGAGVFETAGGYDVVLLDADAPCPAAPEGLPSLAGVPVIHLSKSGLPSAAATDAGAGCGLRKPVRQALLRRAVGEVAPRFRADLRAKAAPESLASVAAVPERRAGGRILLAEDNPVNQMVAQRLLGRLGFPSEAIVTVGHGRAALEALEQEAFDLVFLDVQMPEMDGLEAARGIRAREGGGQARLPIVAMTAHAMSGDRERCLAAGMDDYITKPISAGKLAEVTDRWLPLWKEKESAMFSEIGGSPPVLDAAALGLISGGDAETEAALLGQLLQSAPGMLSRCRLMLEIGDGFGIEHWAHTLKGSGQVFGARTFAGLCQRLEDLGRSGDCNGGAAVLTALEEEWTRLGSEARRLLEERTQS